MKFTSTLVSLALAAGVLANPEIEARDLQQYTDVITAIETTLTSLNQSILAYTGGAPTAVQSASDAVVSAINTGVTETTGFASLTGNDPITFAGSIQSLVDSVTGVVGNLISIKTPLVAAGAGSQTLTDLQDQLKASNALATVLDSKVSSEFQSIAASLSAEIAAALQKGIDAFTGTGGGSAPATSAATSTSAAASSAPASSAPASSAATSTGAATSGASAPATSATGSAAPTSSMAATTTGGGYPVASSTPVASSSSPSGGVASSSGTAPGSSSTPPPFAGAANSVKGPIAAVIAIAAVLAF